MKFISDTLNGGPAHTHERRELNGNTGEYNFAEHDGFLLKGLTAQHAQTSPAEVLDISGNRPGLAFFRKQRRDFACLNR